jgi:hypothetical protein
MDIHSLSAPTVINWYRSNTIEYVGGRWYVLNVARGCVMKIKEAMLSIGRDSRWYKPGEWVACAIIAGTIGMLFHYIFIV